MINHRCASPWIILAILLAAGLAGCGGSGSHQQPVVSSGLPAAVGMLDLPRPSALLARTGKDTSAFDGDLLQSGALFGPLLPHNLVQANGDLADFAPAWDTEGVHTFDGLAYATYGFQALGYNGEPALYINWSLPVAETGNLWIGFANFTRDRWDWRPGPSGNSLNEPKLLNDFRAPDGRVFTVVLLLGTANASLNWLGIGAPLAGAAISASPVVGPMPLAVEFDASSSIAPSGITKFEWDFEGDGTFEEDSGTSPVIQHTYSTGGQRYATVRITTGDSSTATAAVRITVYDETEDNDAAETANTLPGLSPAFTWYGSSGSGEGYPGYDGDDYDYFSFSAGSGDNLSFMLTLDPVTGDLDLALLDAAGSTLDSSSSGTSAVETVSYAFTDSTATYYVRVKRYKGYSDYTLAGGHGTPPAAILTATPNNGLAPLTVNFDASGSSDADGPIAKYEWDFDGDGVIDADTGTTATASHVYTTGGIFSPVVHVTDGDGFSAADSVTVAVGAIPYDEREDNDAYTEANLLPAMPCSGFRGNGGSSGSDDDYDGDNYDWFQLPALSQDTVTVSLQLTPATGNLDLTLYDNAGSYIKGSSSTTAAVEQITYTFLAEDTPPYYIRVYAASGYSDYTLNVVYGAAPEAALTASPTTGALPLAVDFDASGSTDDGSIVKYEWDYEGDGTYDYDSGNDPTITHSYNAEGFFSPTVRVTDDTGLSDLASASVNAGMVYDEVEDNDSTAQANSLPAFAFGSFGGSCGSGTGYSGYDDDDQDFFSLNASVGQTINLTLDMPPVHGDIDIQLLDSTSKVLKSSTTTSAKETVQYTITAADTAPFFLRVYKYSGYSDYLLSGSLAPNVVLTANPDHGAVPLAVTLDASGSNDPDGSIVKYEWDFTGDGVWDQDTGTTPSAAYTFTAAGFYFAKVRITDNSGLANTGGVHVMAGVAYNEVEDNDTTAQATAFPAFPFANFGGSSGTGTGYPGYDGDDTDYFSFSVTGQPLVTLKMTMPAWHGDIDMELTDKDGTVVGRSSGTGATETISATIDSAKAPFYLRVYKYSNFSDYLLEGSLE